MPDIKVKDTAVLESLLIVPYDTKLIEIMSWTFNQVSKGVITEGYRKKRHKHDLHGTKPVRAIDIRSWCYINPDSIAKTINDEWSYDDTRPNKQVAVYHAVKGGASHIHIQVHPNTKRRVPNYTFLALTN